MLTDSVILFVGALLGVLTGCRVYQYRLSTARQISAPLAFAALNAITAYSSMPYVAVLAPIAVMYVLLMSRGANRAKVNKVFGTSMMFTIVAILLVYSP